MLQLSACFASIKQTYFRLVEHGWSYIQSGSAAQSAYNIESVAIPFAISLPSSNSWVLCVCKLPDKLVFRRLSSSTDVFAASRRVRFQSVTFMAIYSDFHGSTWATLSLCAKGNFIIQCVPRSFLAFIFFQLSIRIIVITSRQTAETDKYFSQKGQDVLLVIYKDNKLCCKTV